MFKKFQKIHFVGIGGSGMSGIAEVLLNLGYSVSGSDLKETDVTAHLKKLGAKIHRGHYEKNVGDAHVVVISSAVSANNPEVVASRKRKIPVVPRIEMLCELARLKYTIAVAGTHGKTTTTSMIASILQEAGLDPTFVVGGRIRHLESGARLGTGDFLVAEADESDGSFLKLSPTVSIVTNIDDDHLDYYKSFKNLKNAFIEFANRVPFYGSTIVCLDDPGVRSILPDLTRRVISYGLNPSADIRAQDVTTGSHGTSFTLAHHGESAGKVTLNLWGTHNVLNALAAFACGFEVQVPFETMARALNRFENVERRLEKRGEKHGAIWMDDYGHHPTEIKVTLSAVKDKYPGRKLVVLFQPHRYSRTKILCRSLGESFKGADEVVLLPIYPAGEKPIKGINSKKILPVIKRTGVPASLLNGNQKNFVKYLKPGTVFLTLGAGDVWKVGQKLFQ